MRSRFALASTSFRRATDRGALVALAPLALALVVTACGARTGLGDPPPPLGFDAAADDGGRLDGGRRDGASDDAPMTGTDAARIDAGPHDAGRDVGLDAPFDRGCIAIPDGCGPVERCDVASDDDCDGRVDEGCDCEPGAVQTCFAGPPGRRDVGACTDGTQTCSMTRAWSACLGGIGPSADVCDGRDNLCDGCSAQRDCPIACPSPGDPRTPDTEPFADYPLRGSEFYPGMAARFQWRVEGGPCDSLAPSLVSFDLMNADRETATFIPRLSGDYTIFLDVTTVEGTLLSCSWVVHVRGPGLRIEMCYPESRTQDLDLYLHRPGSTAAWFPPRGNVNDITEDACSWANCEAMIRRAGSPRANWGYRTSPVVACQDGPQGAAWRGLGFCANPRLDIDNNLQEGIGLPENINIDIPGDGETFRVMVQNYSGDVSLPVVNVYCDGRRVATYGARPDTVPGFAGTNGGRGIGAMWRVADVTTHVTPTGELDCDVVALHPPNRPTGYYVTYDDGRY